MRILFCLSRQQATCDAWPDLFSRLKSRNTDVDIGLLALEEGVSGAEEVIPPHVVEVLSLQSTMFPGVPVSSEHLRISHRILTSSEFDRARLAAMKLLNRKDFTGTLRFLDREVILTRAVVSLVDLFMRHPPALVVFQVTPHEFLPFLAQWVARYLGHQTLYFEPSPISPTQIPHSGIGRLLVPSRALVSGSRVESAVRAIARERLGVLRGGQVPQYLEIQKNRDYTVRKLPERVKAVRFYFRWLTEKRFPDSIDFSAFSWGDTRFARMLAQFATHGLMQGLNRKISNLEKRSVAPQGKYVLFALHYEPERTSFPDGLPIFSQGDAVVAARAIVPGGTELVVKEHYSQTSSALRGFLGRSPSFFDIMDDFSNASFVGPSVPASGLIEDAECIFTLTGTIAIEAVFRGVRVAYFGSPWWEGLPGTIRVDADTTWEEIQEVLLPTADEAQEFLEDLVVNHMTPGISAQGKDWVEKRMGPLPSGFFESEAEAMAVCIEHLLVGPERL